MSITHYDQTHAKTAAWQAITQYLAAVEAGFVDSLVSPAKPDRRKELRAQLVDALRATLEPVLGSKTDAFVRVTMLHVLSRRHQDAAKAIAEIPDQRMRIWLATVWLLALWPLRFVLNVLRLGLPARWR